MKNKKLIKRLGRHTRIRKNAKSTADRPRLVVRPSLTNFSAQIIDDTKNITLLSLSTANKEIKSKVAKGGNIKAAEIFGTIFVEKAKAKGISKIVFDRAGFLYHGRVRAFAESLRKGGLEF